MEGILELLRVEVEGVRTIAEMQSIDFEHRDKLMQIDGNNIDTGGSSAAGKSTLAIAIDYLLGISDVAATILTPWEHEQTPKVKGYFRRGTTEIEIERSTKNGLSVTVGGEKTSGGSAIAEEKLDEVLGLPRKIIKKMIHKHQDEGSFFIQMGPKAKYEFLITILGLESKNAEIEFIKDEIKEQAKELTKLNIGIEAVEKNLDTLEYLKDQKIKPVCTVLSTDVSDLKASIITLDLSTTTLRLEKEGKLAELVKPVKEEVVEDNTKLHELMTDQNVIKNNVTLIRQEHQVSINAANGALSQEKLDLQAIRSLKVRAKELSQQMVAKKTEKAQLEHDATCPTCSQSWTGDSAKAKILATSNEIAGLLSEIMSFKEKLDTEAGRQEKVTRLDDILGNLKIKTPWVEEEDKLVPLIDAITAERLRLGDIDKTAQNKYLLEQNLYNEAVNLINANYKQPIADKESQVNGLRQERALLESQLDNFKTQSETYETELATLNSSIEAKYTDLKEAIEKRVGIKQLVEIASEGERCLKSYILNTFQDTLNAIGETATEIVNGIPNVATANIYFEGFKETAKGGIKNEITAVISKDGHEGVPIKALCGGEGRGIGLAVDLAVIDVIESKANKGVDFYLMDEPFNGLDSICREDCLEIIKGIDSNKRIIVIDHCSELKETVTDIIVATKENGKTTFA